MTLQVSTTIRNARADACESIPGASVILKIRTGAPPVNCAAADSGTVLATLQLPGDWMQPAASGVKLKSGTWQDISADSDGVAGYFRLYETNGVTCHMQGTISALSGTGDMKLDSINFTSGQSFSVEQFTITEPNG